MTETRALPHAELAHCSTIWSSRAQGSLQPVDPSFLATPGKAATIDDGDDEVTIGDVTIKT
ncbi:MAG: hypothetical protein ACYCW6_10115 [Candidatus Xenobia bacterium]